MGPDGPRGGRHSSSDFPETHFPAGPGFVAPRYEPSRYEPPTWTVETGGQPAVDASSRATAGVSRFSGLLDRFPDETGPLAEPEWWSYEAGGRGHPMTARHSGPDDERAASQHPSAPLPPMPTGVWDRLHARHGQPDDDATVAQPLLPGAPPPADGWEPRARVSADDDTEAHHSDPSAWEDQTGGLEVIGAHVAEEPPRRRGRRARREAAEAARRAHHAAAGPEHDELEHDELEPDGLVHDEHFGEDIPVKPYDPRAARTRRRRRPLAVLVSLLVLAGLVVGIVVGGQRLLTLIDPSSRDYTGQGTGTVEIRVRNGDTLSDIARTLVDADVVASTGPFITAAEANAESVGIQPGVYALRMQMSGQAALDLMLDPAARLLSRITLPEGLTVREALARLAEATGIPEAEFQAAAANPAALGLPAYANGQLEGFLFPATYDFEPGTAPADVLTEMVAQFTEVAGRLQLEQRAAALGRSPYEVVTIASMVESETRLDAERPDVAQVIYNRLGAGIALGIDATLAYGLDKSGNDLTVSDLQTDGPYNTRTRAGLPPTPISAPGEASLEAALSPTSGDLLYYVLQSAEGAHFFTSSYAEFQAARQRCADAGLGCGG